MFGIAPLIYGIFVVSAGIVLLYNNTKKFIFLQKIKNTPTSKMQSVALGLVELSGTAEGLEQTLSPISKVPCAYWKLLAFRVSGRRDDLLPLYKSESNSRFYLKDETGKIFIDPRGTEINLSEDKEFDGTLSGTRLRSLPEEVLEYIRSLDSDKKALFSKFGRLRLKFIEYYISNGDHLYVLGTAEPIEGASSSVGHENLVIRKGKFDKTMLISDTREKKYFDSQFWSAFWRLILGTIFLILGFILLLQGLDVS